MNINHDDQDGGIYVLQTVDSIYSPGCFTENNWSFDSGCPTLPIIPVINGIINIPNEVKISAYPNPFTESIMVRIELQQSATVAIEIMDILSQAVISRNFGFKSGAIEEPMDVSFLPPGMYIMKIAINNENYPIKLIKK